jgi:iron complex transport system permease protein
LADRTRLPWPRATAPVTETGAASPAAGPPAHGATRATRAVHEAGRLGFPGAAAPAGPAARGSVARSAGLLAALLGLGLVVLLSIAVGAKALGPGTVLQVLLEPDTSDASRIVHELRIPRTVLGLLAGVALGVAGALMQGLTRNPLADPGLFGVNAGAAFAITVTVAITGVVDPARYVWTALAGALLATLLVHGIGGRGAAAGSPSRLVLAGVAVAAALGGMTFALALLNPGVFATFRSWTVGSLTARPLDAALPVAPFVVVGLVVALGLGRSLDAVALGDDVARSMGVSLTRVRLLGLAAVTLLCGAATALVGPIAFLGLIVAHIARLCCGPRHRWVLAYSLVLGPAVLLAADVLGRVVARPGEYPVGLTAAFVGAPILIRLARAMPVGDP